MLIILIAIVVILIVVGLYYWFQETKAWAFYPDVRVENNDITSGARIRLVNAGRLSRGEPAYLTADTSTTSGDPYQLYFESEPTAENVWLWENNKGQCFVLNQANTLWNCSNEYYNPESAAYNCRACNQTTLNDKGFYLCSWCRQDDNDISPLTSVSFFHPATNTYLVSAGFGNASFSHVYYVGTAASDAQKAHWTESEPQSATIDDLALSNFDLLTRIRMTPAGAGLIALYLGDQLTDLGSVEAIEARNDNSLYLIEFLPLIRPDI